jgi:transcriptional regulator with XRE-family HTH domain
MVGDDSVPFGRRLRRLRLRAGLTRPVLGGLVGRSADWVKAVENGRLLTPRLPMLLRLAEVLRVDLVALTGEQSVPIAGFAYGWHAVVPAVRDAVQRYTVTRPEEAPYPVAVLRDRAASAWRSWHTSPTRRTDVGTVLPALLSDCHAAAAILDGADRRAAHAVLADAYRLAQHVLVNAAKPELMWLVAERSMNAAHIADQPVALAGAAWTVGMVLRTAGRMDEALALVDEAATVLEPALPEAPHDWRGLWGALQLHAASTLARTGREGDAWARWTRAADTVRQLPSGYAHSWSMFSGANVDLHGISLTVDLWKSRDALRRAESLDPSTIPSRERRGRLFVEMARGHHAAGERIAATRLLLRACEEGVDAVQWSPAARVIVTDVQHKPPAVVRDDVADLVTKLGAAG